MKAVLRGKRPDLRTAVAVVGVLVLLALLVGGLARVRVDTSVQEFVPRGDAATEATNDVAERFGGDPIVVLLESQEPMELLDKEQLPALLELEGKLAELTDVSVVYGPGTMLNQIAGQAQDMLAELSGYRDGLQARAETRARKQGAGPAEATSAGRRATASFDERYATLLAQGLPGGLPTLHNQKFVDRVILNDVGDPRPRWDFLVPRSNAVAILVRPRAGLEQSEVEVLVAEVNRTVGRAELSPERTTVSGIPSVVAALGQEIRHEIPLLGGAALLAVGAWFLLTGWTRRRFRLLPLAATLLGTAATLSLAGWLGHPLALTAVAFLPVLLGIGTDFMTYLHRGVGRRTVVVAAVAAAAGFAALAIAPIPAVADLGIGLAVGLLISVGVSLAINRWTPVSTTPDSAATEPLGRSSTRHARRRTRVAAVAVLAVPALAGWALLPSLTMHADFRSLASNLSVYDDAQHLERVMGASGEVALVMRGDDVMTAENLEWMTQAHRDVIASRGDTLKPILSPADVLGFLGDDPTRSQLAAALRLLPDYMAGSMVTPDHEMAIMTYGVDLDDVGRLEAARDHLVRTAETAPAGVDVEPAGLPMVAVSAGEALEDDRLLTVALGMFAAGLVLLIGLRHRRVAVLAMTSAALTTGVALLGLWLAGIALTPMTAGLGSLIAVVACEFTVVLAAASTAGDRSVRRAVTLAAAASATGYAVLGFSDLDLIRSFGLLLAATVLLALGVSRLMVWAIQAPPSVDVRGDGVAEQVPVRDPVEVGR